VWVEPSCQTAEADTCEQRQRYSELRLHGRVLSMLGVLGRFRSRETWEVPDIGEPEPIARPRLYKIAHSARFLQNAGKGMSFSEEGRTPDLHGSNAVSG
jgi:hypothetical protein